MKNMEYQIKDDLQPKEYNELRNSVGWDSKDESVIIEALKNSFIVKKIIVNNKAVGMARAIGDGLYYLITEITIEEGKVIL